MNIILNVTKRDAAQSVEKVRAAGNVPAIVYGSKQSTVTVSVAAKEIEAVLKSAGESTIITLEGLDKKMDVLIKDVAFNPVKQLILHVDFYVVEQGKEMTAHVPLTFIGVAPVEESGLGSITKVHQEVLVSCMPNKLPSHFDVDISGLVGLDDKISVSDIAVPTGVHILSEATDAIVVVSEIKTEAEEVAEIVPVA